jgi:hypothetical protein
MIDMMRVTIFGSTPRVEICPVGMTAAAGQFQVRPNESHVDDAST